VSKGEVYLVSIHLSANSASAGQLAIGVGQKGNTKIKDYKSMRTLPNRHVFGWS